jgi:acetoin utilization deacetylase AcuC-like enzyme
MTSCCTSLGSSCAQAGCASRPTYRPAPLLQRALDARGIELVAPPDYGRAPLETVHSPAYLDFLTSAFERWMAQATPTLEPGIEVLPNLSPYHSGKIDKTRRGPCPSGSVIAEAGYYLGDLSCPLGPHSWQSILRSAHSAVAAARHVCAPHDGNGMAYALCRPSGHHAHADRAGGFCYVNNSAIAAQTLLERFDKVAVLDVDAHHGDGTQQIFYQRSDVMTISLHADPSSYYPFYTGYATERGHGAGYGYNLNSRCRTAQAMLDSCRRWTARSMRCATTVRRRWCWRLASTRTSTTRSACCRWGWKPIGAWASVSTRWACRRWWCRRAVTKWMRSASRWRHFSRASCLRWHESGVHMTTLNIDGQRLWQSLMDLAAIGATPRAATRGWH